MKYIKVIVIQCWQGYTRAIKYKAQVMAININISGAHGNLSNAAPLDDLGKQLEELDCFIHSTLYHFY